MSTLAVNRPIFLAPGSYNCTMDFAPVLKGSFADTFNLVTSKIMGSEQYPAFSNGRELAEGLMYGIADREDIYLPRTETEHPHLLDLWYTKVERPVLYREIARRGEATISGMTEARDEVTKPKLQFKADVAFMKEAFEREITPEAVRSAALAGFLSASSAEIFISRMESASKVLQKKPVPSPLLPWGHVAGYIPRIAAYGAALMVMPRYVDLGLGWGISLTAVAAMTEIVLLTKLQKAFSGYYKAVGDHHSFIQYLGRVNDTFDKMIVRREFVDDMHMQLLSAGADDMFDDRINLDDQGKLSPLRRAVLNNLFESAFSPAPTVHILRPNHDLGELPSTGKYVVVKMKDGKTEVRAFGFFNSIHDENYMDAYAENALKMLVGLGTDESILHVGDYELDLDDKKSPTGITIMSDYKFDYANDISTGSRISIASAAFKDLLPGKKVEIKYRGSN